MVDLYDGPSREGTRGGLEQFTWDSVKGQVFRDRECYLGQSVRVGVQGKFGRFLTNDWWVRKREDPKKISEEQDIVKRFEEELMQEALGVKPKRLLLIKGELTEAQKKEVLCKIDEPEISVDSCIDNLDTKKKIKSKKSKRSRSPCIQHETPITNKKRQISNTEKCISQRSRYKRHRSPVSTIASQRRHEKRRSPSFDSNVKQQYHDNRHKTEKIDFLKNKKKQSSWPPRHSQENDYYLCHNDRDTPVTSETYRQSRNQYYKSSPNTCYSRNNRSKLLEDKKSHYD